MGIDCVLDIVSGSFDFYKGHENILEGCQLGIPNKSLLTSCVARMRVMIYCNNCVK